MLKGLYNGLLKNYNKQFCDNIISNINNAIKTKTNYNSGRLNFRSYDTTINIKVTDNNLEGFLSLEYRNCGNGHYFLLINDTTFIYYSKD